MKPKHLELGIGIVVVGLCIALHLAITALPLAFWTKAILIGSIDIAAFVAHQFSNALHDEVNN